MKELTYSSIATARLRSNKRGYRNLIIGIFLSVFLVSSLVLSVYGIYEAQLEKRYAKVGYLDMAILDDDSVTEENLRSLGLFDRLGHAYVSGVVTGRNVYVGYYDAVGLSLMNLKPLEGRLPEGPGEIALEASALDVLDAAWQIGDTAELAITPVDGAEEIRRFVVVGILPERSIYLGISDNDGLCQFPAIVTSGEEPAFAIGRVAVHYLMGLRAHQTLQGAIDTFWEKFRGYDVLLHRFYGLSVSGEQLRFPAIGNLMDAGRDMLDLILMAVILAGSLLLSCGIGISGSMEGLLVKQQEEIGVFRALGATRRQIRKLYGRENLILALVVSPLSIAVSCVAVWGLSCWIPGSLKFAFRLWLLLPVAVFSMVVILISGYLPLVRVSKLMPMHVIRDTAILRRSAHIQSKKNFFPSKLISARQVRFHPTRQIGAALLVGLMLLCPGLLGTLASSFQSYTTAQSPGFTILTDSGFSRQNYVSFYSGSPLSSQSIRQIKALNHVKFIRIDRIMSVFAQVDTIPRYALFPGFNEQFGMLDDAMFEEAMSFYNSDSGTYDFYQNLRTQERDNYLQFLKDYQFEKQAFQLSIQTMELDSKNLETLKGILTDGAIHTDAINAGTEVLLYAPNIYANSSETGRTSLWDSATMKKDPSAKDARLVVWNDAFSVGQRLPLTQLYSEDGGTTVIRKDTQVSVCGTVEQPCPVPMHGYSCTIITTEQGLENMGLRADGLQSVDIYLAGELTPEEEERLERQLNAIARRSEGCSVVNYAERQRKQEQSNRQQVLLCACVVTVFFAVAVGMIVSSVTRQLNSEGRTIGMLRAVGADEKAILGCYSGQLNAAVLGGLGITLALVGVFLGIYALDAAIHNYSLWYSNLVVQVVTVVSTAFVMAAACWIVCRCILRQRIREILRKSIIENIREL